MPSSVRTTHRRARTARQVSAWAAESEGLEERAADDLLGCVDRVEEALRTGLMPTLNSMNVLGLVSIPGMMTGQVLGGSPPLVAAKYQALIMFLICFTSATALYIATRLASRKQPAGVALHLRCGAMLHLASTSLDA